MGCGIDWRLVLDYIRVILSWPVVVGVGGIVAAIYFRLELKGLINRISSVKIMGQEVALQQAKIAEESGTETSVRATLNNDAQAPDFGTLRLSPEQQQAIREAFQSEQAAARVWEYRFMNYFFAPATQAVLTWLVGLDTGTTLNAYAAFWTLQVPLPQERQAILDALQMHNCIAIDGQLLTVTEKGREYANWPDRKILSATLPSARAT